MKTSIKVGLIVGTIAVVPNLCAAGLIGPFAPSIPPVAGLLAGFLTAQREKLPTKGAGARSGAIAGLLAGLVMLAVQVIFTLIVEKLEPGPQAVLQSLTAGLVIYLIATGLACLAGAAAGYLGTRGKADINT